MPVINGVTHWQPFQLDALGLVTLLGANSLQKSLGRLVRHPWAEYLPLLGGQVIPDDLISETVPGFTLYNATDGIKVDGVNAWFARWLLSQELSACSTSLTIDISPEKTRTEKRKVLSICLGLLVHAFLIVFSILLGDWYAFASGISLSLSSLARILALEEFRRALDERAKQANERSLKPVKVYLTCPNNKSVTIYTTGGVIIMCLLAEVRPVNEQYFRLIRGLGWVAFGVFVVALAGACVAMGIIFAVLMIVSTFVVIRGIGCDDARVGSRVHINLTTKPGKESHMRTYATMQLTEKEENAMINWHLFPLVSNEDWWADYKKFSTSFHENPKAFEA